jgi:hypothetical protein
MPGKASQAIEKYGRKANMMKWKSSDCPKRDAHQLHECCDLICPTCRKCFEPGSAQDSDCAKG